MRFDLRWALVLAITGVSIASAATVEQWRSRSIYQVLTDRFARSDISITAKCNVTEGVYCGGTYQGIMRKLDYIQDMGFSAIWISPITYNIPEKTKFGYAWHGYWQQDLYRLNEYYGTARDLKALSRALHARNMYLMVDVVTNHNGFNGSVDSVNYSRFHPFNDTKYYHDYCVIADYTDQIEVENCWLGDNTVPLPDLRTEDQAVRNMYGTWISQLVSNYSIDGLRIDTVKYVDKAFWGPFQRAANTFATGEVVSSNMTFACSYQNDLSSVLNYPVYYAIINFLNSTSGTTTSLMHAAQTFKTTCKDTSVLATFTENHDLPRFASQTKDMALAKNALALTLLWDGIPVVYAGQEQHYAGYADPANREATWLSGYSQQGELYKLTRTLNRVRNRALALDPAYATYNIWPIYNDAHTIAFRKGFYNAQIVSVFTNTGSSSSSSGSASSWTLTLPAGSTGWKPGDQVVEVLSCTKYTIPVDGSLAVKMQHGLPRVFFPVAAAAGDARICSADRAVSPSSSYSNNTVGAAAPTETKKSVAKSLASMALAGKKTAAAVAGVVAYEVLTP